MRRTCKPVRECHSCLLNLGERCWLYAYPRGQWRGRRCRAFENEKFYADYEEWKKQPTVRTRRELRREAFRSRKPAEQEFVPARRRK